MRVKISEKNILPNFDLYEEYRKIEYFLSEALLIGTVNQFERRSSPQFTLEQYIDDLYFLDWNLRGTFISIEEMRAGLGISKSSLTSKSINPDLVLEFIQYAANCNLRVAETIGKCNSAYLSDENVVNALIENMKAVLEKLGARFSIDENTTEAFVVFEDDLSFVVANSYPEINHSIVEYKRIDNKGDLQRKGEILCTLFKRLEAYEKKFKGTVFDKLCSDTTFLFNKTGARHWVEKDKIASKTFLAMSLEELEIWYDRTYTMFLSCMIAAQYVDIKNEIEEIKRVN